MRSAVWLLVASSLACSGPAGREPVAAECAKCLGEQTIEELIDMGGEPTGWWYKDGRSLPVYELKKHPREAVLAELRKRMGNRQFVAKYRDAFVVYALRGLLVKDLAAELLRVYPTLNDAGRYEVLVYGVEYELATYAPLFMEVLERSDPARVELRDLLAALYAIRVPSESLVPGLRRLEERIAAEWPRDRRTNRNLDSDCSDFTSLDGFPFRGLGLLGVCDREATVLYALSRIERYRPVQPMSAEEAELLARVRNALLHPVRRRIEIDGLPLEEAFREFWRVFEMEPSESTLGTLRRIEGKVLASSVTFRSEEAAASEVIAAICNQTGLTIVQGFGAVLLGSGNTPMRNTCVAAEGMIFQVRIWAGNPPNVRGFVSGATSLGWHQLAERGFELDAAILPGGVDAGDQFELGVRGGLFSLEVDHAAWRESERIEELRGTITQPIPTAMRRIEVQPEVGKTVTRELEDYRNIAVKCVAASDGSWELEITIARELYNFPLPVNPDTEIQLLLPEAGTTAGRGPRRSLSVTRSRLEYREVPPGTRVVWTYESASEVLRVPVVWRSVGDAGADPPAR